jgi:hypothetical protein
MKLFHDDSPCSCAFASPLVANGRPAPRLYAVEIPVSLVSREIRLDFASRAAEGIDFFSGWHCVMSGTARAPLRNRHGKKREVEHRHGPGSFGRDFPTDSLTHRHYADVTGQALFQQDFVEVLNER